MSSNALSEASTNVKPVQNAPTSKGLTQKEYMIAVRNRLFAIEEQIWLSDHLKARPNPKIQDISRGKYLELVATRGDLLAEYPLAALQLDLKYAIENGYTYAAIYLERKIADLKRSLPLSLDHVNQIAVLSFSGQV